MRDSPELTLMRSCTDLSDVCYGSYLNCAAATSGSTVPQAERHCREATGRAHSIDLRELRMLRKRTLCTRVPLTVSGHREPRLTPR